jgi:hypothetical protein
MATPLLQEPPDFSLVLGGPLYQLLRKAHLTGPTLELLRRRMLLAALVTWLPLAVLTLIEGRFGGGDFMFIPDIYVHVRFLVALPVLIGAELIVHQRVRLMVQRFLDRSLIKPEEMPRFQGAIEAATRLRNSLPLEVGLVIFVYTGGLWIWRSEVAVHTASWYAVPAGAHLQLTMAGYWQLLVSLPIFQFILLRWYLRLFIWFRFLWSVSRLDLQLLPAHPDRAGGLAFLGVGASAFAPILFAQGAVLAGLIADRIFYEGQNLISFKATIAGFVALFVGMILAPLLLFAPQLVAAKRRGLADYGTLATTYVAGFEKRWLRGGHAQEQELLGTGDIQSLADLGNSFAFVRDMRPVPFSLQDVIQLAVAAAAPVVPLLLTIMPLEELLTRIIGVVF